MIAQKHMTLWVLGNELSFVEYITVSILRNKTVL